MSNLFFQDLMEARAEVGKLLYNIVEKSLDPKDKKDIVKAYVLLVNLERKRQGMGLITIDKILKA